MAQTVWGLSKVFRALRSSGATSFSRSLRVGHAYCGENTQGRENMQLSHELSFSHYQDHEAVFNGYGTLPRACRCRRELCGGQIDIVGFGIDSHSACTG